MTLTLTSEQDLAVDAILDWSRDPNDQTFVLAGLAGTGKTTILQTVVERLSASAMVAVVTPTGKAAHVLNMKDVPATTIHRFCYKCRGEDAEGALSFEFQRDVVDLEGLVVVVDESSMIDRRVYNDLVGTKCKLLFVGDHGQLAPVGEDPEIMKHPDFRLETILRQAQDSDIIRFAHHLRLGEDPEDFDSSDDITFGAMRDWGGAQPDIWLCGTNANRVALNRRLRSTDPTQEQIVILRNDYSVGVMNGQVLQVKGITRNEEGNPLFGNLPEGRSVTFNPLGWFAEKTPFVDFKDRRMLADYGYALTVHKAQGSEWDHVGVLADKDWGDDIARWRYTAATRARKKLTWITA